MSLPTCTSQLLRRDLETGRPLGRQAEVGRLASLQVMATESSTAQVHPAKLTQAFLDAAIARGARLRLGTVTGLDLSADQPARVEGVPWTQLRHADFMPVACVPA